MEYLVHVGFMDGASHDTQDLSSTTWVIYFPEGQVVVSGGTFLGPTMNNVAKYNIVIEILRDSIAHGNLCLQVYLDSQLVVLKINGQYHVHDPMLLR
jgi:ribonuclease HI